MHETTSSPASCSCRVQSGSACGQRRLCGERTIVSDDCVLRRTRLLNGALPFPITVQLTRTFKQGHAHTPDAASRSMANGGNARIYRSRDSAVSADPGRSAMGALANANRGKKRPWRNGRAHGSARRRATRRRTSTSRRRSRSSQNTQRSTRNRLVQKRRTTLPSLRTAALRWRRPRVGTTVHLSRTTRRRCLRTSTPMRMRHRMMRVSRKKSGSARASAARRPSRGRTPQVCRALVKQRSARLPMPRPTCATGTHGSFRSHVRTG